MSQVLNKASKQLLVDLINQTNGKNFAAADLIFGVPQPEGDRPQQNTTVLVNLATKPEPENSISIFYNRINFGKMFEDKLIQVVDTGGFATVGDFVPYLNSTYGLGLVAADDLQDTAFTVGTKPFVVQVRAKPSSLVYTGQFQILLVDEIVDPTPDVATSDQTLGDVFQQVNSDKLFIDGMLDDGHFAKTVDPINGTILALRARSTDGGPIAPNPGTNDYDLMGDITSAGGVWNVDYALQFDMAGRNGYVTDYYDIKLKVAQGAESYTLTLTQTNGVFAFTNGALSLPVDYAYVRGTQLQGDVDLSVVAAAANFATAMPDILLNPDGAPYDGPYDVTLTADRKGDADDMHLLTITVDTGG